MAVEWIPREENGVCDELARSAITNGGISLSVAPGYAPFHCNAWKSICAEFVKRFDMSPLYPLRQSCVVRPWIA